MVLFRVDGNQIVGLGHVMRCLSIADAFLRSGEDCLLITSGSEPHKTIENLGFKCFTLGSEYNNLECELKQFIDVIENRDVKAIFVDSYYVTYSYLQTLHQLCKKKQVILVYIDDVLAFPYPCDVLLNYNIYAIKGDYIKLYAGHELPELLLNTSFQPIRTEFHNLPNRVVKKMGRDILISTGGSDAEHMGVEIIKSVLSHSDWREFRFHFIVGMMNNDSGEIEKLAKDKGNIIIHNHVKQMAVLMQNCDVAISAAGSTLYELCATQTPSLIYITADNQIPGAECFEKKGIFKCMGDIRFSGQRILTDKMLNEAIVLAKNYEKRVEIASSMKNVIDGKGSDRIVKEVLPLLM